MKKIVALLLAVAMTATLAACGAKPTTPNESSSATSAAASESTSAAPAKFSIAMVTDTGGVNDQSFNQSAWEGMQKANKDWGAEVKYLESKQEADYVANLDKLTDETPNLIWGVGFMMADAVLNAAKSNPDQNYAIVDFSYDPETPANLTGVVFKVQEPSFVAGYIAAAMTKTNKVGFIGGIKGIVIDQFEYGYRAGVAYANKELKKNVTVEVQYCDSFTDAAKGKSIANTQYAKNCDIIFAAAGNAGNGMFEAAKENKKLCIGVDKDQSYLAPDNTITSAMKLVGQGIYTISKNLSDGQKIGGQTFVLDTKGGACGIAPNTKKLIPDDIYANALKVQDKIVAGEIVPPATEPDFKKYTDSLK